MDSKACDEWDFGDKNFRNEVNIKRNQSLPKTGNVNLVVETENLYIYALQDDFIFKNQLIDRDPYWGDLGTRPSNKKNNPSLIVTGREFRPPEYRRWSYSSENVNDMYNNNRLKVENDKLKIYIDKRRKGTNWTDIPGYSSTPTWGFSTENSEKLLLRAINMSSEKKDFVLDFFLGSATTTAVAHKLGRKWIGIEMGEHFNTVVLTRMKKVLAYDKSGISKEKDVKERYSQNNAGGFFKYCDLEQYEQALRRCQYIPSDPFFNLDEKPVYEQYVFLKDPKFLETMELDYTSNKVKIDFVNLYPNIDIAETLSMIKGMWIKKIGTDYVILTNNNGNEERIDYSDIDFKTIKPLLWW